MKISTGSLVCARTFNAHALTFLTTSSLHITLHGCLPLCPGRQHPAGALAEADAEAVALAVRAEAHGIAVPQERALQARRNDNWPRAVARRLQQACRATRLLQMTGVRCCDGEAF